MASSRENPTTGGVRDGEAVSFTPGPWLAKMQFGEWFVRQDPSPWDGMGYQLICTLPAGRKKTHYGDMFAANARLIAAAPGHHEAAREIDRLMLVIESAVRYADPGNYAAVMAALKANRAAIDKALIAQAEDTSERSVPARDEAKS